MTYEQNLGMNELGLSDLAQENMKLRTELEEAQALSEHRREQLEQCANTLQETIGEKVSLRQALEEAKKSLETDRYDEAIENACRIIDRALKGGE